MPSPPIDGDTEVAGDLIDSSSQAGPLRSADDRMKEDALMVQRVSRNGRVERVHRPLLVTQLHIVTNMGVLGSYILRDYPAWRVALPEYSRCTWLIFALNKFCQQMAGWIRQQDLNGKRRGPRGGS